MAITRISRLHDCGVFRDFTWPADLPTFGRYNLIYGWNGSGKTTISKPLRALETRTPPVNGEVTLSINGADVPDKPDAKDLRRLSGQISGHRVRILGP